MMSLKNMDPKKDTSTAHDIILLYSCPNKASTDFHPAKTRLGLRVCLLRMRGNLQALLLPLKLQSKL